MSPVGMRAAAAASDDLIAQWRDVQGLTIDQQVSDVAETIAVLQEWLFNLYAERVRQNNGILPVGGPTK